VGSFEQIILPKGSFLLREGATCHHLYFIESGAVRGFYNIEGREVTHWFGFEKDFVTSFHSFITQQPSVENVQLMEGSQLWSISYEKLQALMKDYHEIERVVRKAYETYYIRLEERFVNAHFKTATERYSDLIRQNPHFVERVSLGAIASYLGISPETLSRIRARV